jgi:cytochrome c oxidase cbb3-type subunit III
MAEKIERDSLTGVQTTGHEWDGIKELDNPMPRWWLWVFYACIAFSVLWWILYPAWPTHSGYSKGVIGSNQRVELDERLAEARAAQGAFIERIAAAEPEAITAEPDLLQFAVAGGERHFKDNCAGCHGLGGGGQLHYPSLADDAWIWGGSLEAIRYTINHGIRNEEDMDARFNMMPRYGVDGLLTRDEIDQVVQHVLSLSEREHDAEQAAAGAEIYEIQCAACHGEQGEGIQDLGGPALNDAVWLYGGEPEEITAQIWNPRHGVMPPWQGRLDDEVIKMLAVYVHNLGGGQ